MIRFEGVSKIYDGQRRAALDDVNVDIEKGEFVFLVGASGSGKSTFLRLILREQRPTKGKVFVAGREVAKLHSWKIPAMRRQIGTVFQDFRLLPNNTVTDNVAFALQVIGKPASTIRRVVPEVGVSSLSRRRRNVDLPDPEDPMRKTNSPLSISVVTSSRAGRPLAG